ncbi:MAG TPA: flagellar basal body-associated FliL family protein [Gemmatimonadaceae bacterium]
MATQVIEQVPDGAAAAAPATSGKRNLIILATAGLLAGSAVGLFAIGPILAKRKAAHPAPKVEEKPTTPITHEFQNIVLNPAGSNGTRFLMVSAAFELKDGNTDQLMKDREPEVRDRILALLGQKSIETLTDFTQRDNIKKEVLEAIAPMFPKGSVVKVFFPQFVIQ